MYLACVFDVEVHTGRLCALIVRDETSAWKPIDEFIESNGYEVTTAHGEWAANQILEQCRVGALPPFDLVIISDVWIPRCMTGELERIQKEFPDFLKTGHREVGLRLCELAA